MTLAIDTGPACLWGFYDSSDWQRSTNGLATYDAIDKLIGKPMSATSPQLSWAIGNNADGSPRYQRFYAPRLDADRVRGRVSVMTWISFNLGHPEQNAAFNNESILAGKHDAYIQQFAQDAAAYGHKFVVRFNPEMNGWWEGPFSEYDSSGKLANGNTDGSYARMWRYVVGKVKPTAPNILWYWCANPVDRPGVAAPTAADKLAHFYPGDDLVDFVGYDVYNKASDAGSPWLTFRECLEGRPSGWPANSLAPMLTLAPGKPWMLGEVGCAPATAGDTTSGAGDRSAWIADMFDQIRTRYQFVKLILWYNPAPYTIDAAAAVGWTQGTASPNFPGAPLPDPESVLYRVVSTTTGTTTNDAQVATLTAQLATLQQRLSADDTQLQGSLGQIATLNTQLVQANNRLAQYQQASAQLIGGTDALRGLQQASP